MANVTVFYCVCGPEGVRPVLHVIRRVTSLLITVGHCHDTLIEYGIWKLKQHLLGLLFENKNSCGDFTLQIQTTRSR